MDKSYFQSSITLMKVLPIEQASHRLCRRDHVSGVFIKLSIYVRFHADTHYYTITYNTTYSDVSFGRLTNAFSLTNDILLFIRSLKYNDCWLTPIQRFFSYIMEFYSAADWNNSPRVDMSLHLDTLFWFRANHSLLFPLNAECLAEMQQIPILYSLVWPDRGSNPRSTALETNTLTITPPIELVWNIASH